MLAAILIQSGSKQTIYISLSAYIYMIIFSLFPLFLIVTCFVWLGCLGGEMITGESCPVLLLA